jgi:hypothetical protein
MARHTAEEDEWEDEEEGWYRGTEDGEDMADEDEEPTIPCPYCKRQIHEESQRCPHCENYISAEDAPPTAKPWWIIVGTLLCLYVVYLWIVG